MRFAQPDQYGMISWHFYILACKNDRFYVGSSGHVVSRIEQHLRGLGAVYTRKYKVDSVVAIYTCLTHRDALWWERYFSIRLVTKRPSIFDARQIQTLMDSWFSGGVRCIRGKKLSDQPYEPSTERPTAFQLIEITPEMAAEALRREPKKLPRHHKVKSAYIGPMTHLY